METETVSSDPWRKHKIIQVIAAFDIAIATFSIFYIGKTLLSVFDGLRSTDQEESNWLMVFLIFFFTFGIQFLYIIFAMLLFHASRKTSCSLPRAICIAKVWCISSATFLVLLIVEFIIGLTTFEYNSAIILFIVFCIGKIFWRIYTIYYVTSFQEDLNSGLTSSSSAQEDPVFKLILTNPENCDVDVTDNETQIQEQKSAPDDDDSATDNNPDEPA